MTMYNFRYLLISFVIALGAIGGAVSVTHAQDASATAGGAANTAAIAYPIAELGSCKDKKDCKAYCADAAHMTACVAFAESHGLLKGEDLRKSKLVAEKIAAKQTPGGCTSQGECEAYCNGNVAHLNECLAFGEQLGTISSSDLAEAKKIASALQNGASMPGSCKTKAECENYCAVGAHIDECLTFAEKSGILPADQLAEARKVAPFLKSGETPGKCDSKASCDAYCAADTHFTECLSFAEKAGFVSAEDAAIAKKTGGKGPGGCSGKEACQAYCNDEANATACLNFAQEHGLLTAEQKDLVANGMDQLKAGLAAIPEEARAEVTACLETAVGGKDKLSRLLSKQDTPTQAMGDKIKACFANVSAIMQKVMTAKYGQQGAGAPSGATGAPNPSEMVPSSVPPEMRAQIEEQIKAQMQGAGQTGAVPPAGQTPPAGAPSAGQGAPAASAETCAPFVNVPSCSYVPAGPGHDLCVQCKG